MLCACAPLATRTTDETGEPPPATTEEGRSAQTEIEQPEPDSPVSADPADEERAPDEARSAGPGEPKRPEAPQPGDQPAAKAEPEQQRETQTPAQMRTPDPAPPEPEVAPTPRPAPESPAIEREISISGRITLIGGDADAEDAIVYFIPADGTARPDPADTAHTREIVTRDKSLSPTVLAVSRGSRVHFPNQDPILHNLFSVSAENGFDLGVYGPGESPSVTFDEPGVVNIYCNVHHDMHAHVLVVDTPWRTRPDPAGRFRLTGLPGGPGELHVWHRQSERWSRSLELPAGGPVEVSLEVSRPRLPPHRDKAGQSYSRRDRDPYR